MKHLILKAVLVSGLTFLAAGSLKAQSDSAKVQIDYGKGISIDSNKKARKVTISIGGENFVKISGDSSTNAKKGRFVGGITFTRLDIGLAKLVDNGSFSLSPVNDFLDYKPWKTSTLSFDVLQFGYRFNNHFKVYLAGGFDWTHIRLDRDITIQKNKPTLEYTEDDIMYSKNRFSSSYVHFPLNFEFRTKENNNGKRFRFVVGPEVAFLLSGKVKQVSDELGKVKVKDDYNFAPFRYGGAVRIGYGGIGVFAKYYANDMFDTDAQKGLKNMSFGITLGLN